MIEASGLCKQYGDIRAVRDLSFSVNQGEVVGLLGPNGAGKTTTMRLLTTFLPPSAGTAKVAGFDVCRQAAEVRASIGYLPETPPLYPEMRVREYLTFLAKIKGVARKNIRRQLDDVIERCALGEVRDRLCCHLSRGFRQRTGLAGALIHNPAVIILDEPTSGLDPAQIIEIRRLIRDLQENHTVVLSTHILPEVAETCSKVIIIVDGRIAVEGALDQLSKEKSLEAWFMESVGRDTALLADAVEEPLGGSK